MENRNESETPETATRLSSDLELLADERRREVIASLREMRPPVAVADLARRIADAETDESPEGVPDHGETVVRSLRHCHLPKLAAADVVRRDQERSTVEPGAAFGRLARLQRSIVETEAAVRADGRGSETGDYDFRDWFACPECDEQEEVATLAHGAEIVFECYECGLISEQEIDEAVPLRNLDVGSLVDSTDDQV